MPLPAFGSVKRIGVIGAGTKIDIAALEKIADVSRHGALTEIRLRESVSLIELERALQARLPLVTRAAA